MCHFLTRDSNNMALIDSSRFASFSPRGILFPCLMMPFWFTMWVPCRVIKSTVNSRAGNFLTLPLDWKRPTEIGSCSIFTTRNGFTIFQVNKVRVKVREKSLEKSKPWWKSTMIQKAATQSKPGFLAGQSKKKVLEIERFLSRKIFSKTMATFLHQNDSEIKNRFSDFLLKLSYVNIYYVFIHL